MKKLLKRYWKDLLFLSFITFILMIPYLFMDLLPMEHDTFFHVSRIEQLSRSISEGNWFPAIYPYENFGFGYCSALFYCDILLIPEALLHLAGVPISICYKVAVIGATFISAVSMAHFAHKVSGKRSIAWIAAAAYLFSNYHITDIYVRGALGEIFAMMFLPLVLEGMYVILWKNEKKWGILALGLTGLAVSHDLSFLMGVVLCIILFLIKIKTINKQKMIVLVKGIGIAFLLTLFFTLPMIEQLLSQKFVLNYGTDLGINAMHWWQFFVNDTVFGHSGANLAPSETMNVNVGYFLMIAPLLWLFFGKEKKQHPWVMVMLVIGYICMILPTDLIPWSSLTFLRTLQFPWRLSAIAMLCLAIPAAYGVEAVCNQKSFPSIVVVVMCAEAVYHVVPVFTRTFGITSDMTWQDVLDGDICDPCYSATYARVELAGADYLPQNSPDFRSYSTAIKDSDENDLDISYTKNGTKLTFTAEDESTSSFVLPLTYYKGYQVAKVTDNGTVSVNVYETGDGMVACDNDGAGTYVCWYEDTPLRKICMNVSLDTAVLLGLAWFWKKKREKGITEKKSLD